MTTLTEQLEQRLAPYDDACAKLQGIRAELEKVQEDHAATRDDDHLSTLDRAKKTIHLKSMVDVLTSDESRQQKVVDELKAQVFALSDELFNIDGGAIGSAIHSKTQSLLAELQTEFDTGGAPFLREMVETHRTVKALKEVQSGIGNYAMFDAAWRLAAARRFRRDVLEKLV
jgi:hypothetical protein